jgi:subtilisin-like proprotein convertase family protein
MSNGDGRQGSHWKDDDLLTGVEAPIGAMDPVATEGKVVTWTAADERAMSLIGWDTAPAALPSGISGITYQDQNANGTFEPNAGDFILDTIRVYQDLNNDGQFDDGLEERFARGDRVPVTIPDGSFVETSIDVEDLPGTVRDVNVFVDIIHPYTFDLEATLISPTGREVTLFDDVGSQEIFLPSEDIRTTTLDDEAVERIQDGQPPYRGSFRPMQSLSLMDGETMNGTWTLRIRDWVERDEGELSNWGLIFDTGNAEPNTFSDFEGRYEFADLAPGTYRLRQVVYDGFYQTEPVGNGAHVVTLDEGQQVTRDFGQMFGVPSASVVGRHVFYNRSKFDGNDPAANAADDAAIARDKQALRPAQAATPANYTNYARGINGLMIDIANLPQGSLSAADFGFRVGNNENVFGWATLAQNPAVSVRRGAGVNGSDRVTLTWPDGAIRGQWLQVTVRANGNTGLQTSDVFYFGNLPGDQGESTTEAAVTTSDVLAVRRAMGQADLPIADRRDLNHDGVVNVSDYAAARAHMGRSLHLLSVGDTQGAAGAAGADQLTVVPVTTRRAAYRPVRVWDETAPALI